MKFRDYITEKLTYPTDGNADSFLPVWATIKKDCAPFIKELKSTHIYSLFYRGLSKNVGDIKKITPRKNRKPKDTPIEIHKMLDDMFKKKFGWKVRSEGVFAVADYMEALQYGNAVIFFPIGKYKYIWSPEIADLYTMIRDEIGMFDRSDFSKGEWDEVYGPDQSESKGTWVYNGKKIPVQSWYENAYDYVIYKILKDEEDKFDNRLMKWKPDVSYRDWVKMEKEKSEDGNEDAIDEIVKTYITTNMKEAIKTDNEVMFSCKSYYAIDRHYKDLLIDAVYDNKLPEK